MAIAQVIPAGSLLQLPVEAQVRHRCQRATLHSIGAIGEVVQAIVVQFAENTLLQVSGQQ
ncbi:hypothetical protein D3C84_1227120 [compost metagenome]